MDLVVDKPRTGGSWSSNDGNTARRFFNEVQVFAEITGIEKHLHENCAILLEIYRIWSRYCSRTIFENYAWHYIPPSVLKILLPAPDIIQHALVSIAFELWSSDYWTTKITMWKELIFIKIN